jgi:multidrug efflux pump subunit AcrA (membrane-fusion protein)
VEEAGASADERAIRVRHAQENLAREKALAEQQVAAARADLALAQAKLEQLVAPARPEDVDVLKAQVSQAEANLARLTARLAQARLYAPFDGTVLSLEAQVGDQVKAYAPVGAIGDPSEVQVLAFVFEEHIGSVAYDQAVTVVLDNDLDSVHPAHVLRVASQPMTWQGKRAYQVTIAFDEPAMVPAVVRTGCDVYIPSGAGPGKLLIPSTALYTVGSLTYVEVVEEGEKASGGAPGQIGTCT